MLSWRLTATLAAHFCVAAVEDVIEQYGKSDIMNADQGRQFTSEAFTGLIKDNDIKLRMDGKGTWCHNVVVERLWRSVKYDEVYFHA